MRQKLYIYNIKRTVWVHDLRVISTQVLSEAMGAGEIDAPQLRAVENTHEGIMRNGATQVDGIIWMEL